MSEEKVEYVSKRGGARKGAGRKTKYENTVVTRVAEIYLGAIKALIQHLDDTAHINKFYPNGSESDQIFQRSLDGHAQNISFFTRPILTSE